MLERLPVQIDPYRLAQSGQWLKGELSLTSMGRLLPSILPGDDAVTVELHFVRDPSGWTVIDGVVQGALRLDCHRCMQEMALPVDLKLKLAVINDRSEMEQLPEHYDPLLLEESTVVLSDIIEDELILLLPIVPMHDESDCEASEILNGLTDEMQQAVAEEKESKRDNPFAVLAELKR